MKPNNKILKIITNETKSSINHLKIVTPSIFSTIFSKFAQSHNIMLKNEVELSRKLIEFECKALTTLQETTSQNVNLLSNSTSRAITAIQDKDDDTLNEVLQETQSLKDEIEKLKELIYSDVLTNTFNRKWLYDNFTNSEAMLTKDKGILALIDLNDFKIVNDTYGHIIGDKVLVFFANEFLALGHPVIRYGGDEFIIVFPQDTENYSALQTLNSLREKLLTKKLKANNKLFSASFSFGIKEFEIDDDFSEIIEEADKKMYEDKLQIKKTLAPL
jgi:diguanylate cyclase (GGDEF)-like protein